MSSFLLWCSRSRLSVISRAALSDFVPAWGDPKGRRDTRICGRATLRLANSRKRKIQTILPFVGPELKHKRRSALCLWMGAEPEMKKGDRRPPQFSCGQIRFCPFCWTREVVRPLLYAKVDKHRNYQFEVRRWDIEDITDLPAVVKLWDHVQRFAHRLTGSHGAAASATWRLIVPHKAGWWIEARTLEVGLDPNLVAPMNL